MSATRAHRKGMRVLRRHSPYRYVGRTFYLITASYPDRRLLAQLTHLARLKPPLPLRSLDVERQAKRPLVRKTTRVDPHALVLPRGKQEKKGWR